MTEMPKLEAEHRIALARELTYAAGYPLRDRYGYAARSADVAFIVDTLIDEPDNIKAGELIGMANLTLEIQIAEDDAPASEEYEQGIIRALRPLIEDRRRAGQIRVGLRELRRARGE